MPIFSVGSTSDLLGQNGGRRNGYSDESAQAEWFLYEFLIKHLRLTEPDARQTIVSVIDAGEDLVELALGIENYDEIVIDRIRRHQPFGDFIESLDRGRGDKKSFSADPADAEWLIYEFLIRNFKLTERQTRQVMVSLINDGEDVIAFAQRKNIFHSY